MLSSRSRTSIGTIATAGLGQVVAARLEHLVEAAVDVAQATGATVDDHLVLGHGSPLCVKLWVAPYRIRYEGSDAITATDQRGLIANASAAEARSSEAAGAVISMTKPRPTPQRN
jgi:hypothetical protein